MKKILFISTIYIYTILELAAQNFLYNQNPAGPYGNFDWSWNTSAYQKHEYKSPVDHYYMPYRLLVPPNNDPAKKYPLFIMLHGGGEGMGTPTAKERGTNECQLVWGGKLALDSSNKYPSYVFFPQTWGAWWGNNNGVDYEYQPQMEAPMRAVFEIIEDVLLKNYNIDPDRIYISGLSNGARGAWEMVERRPDLFAATSTFSGMGNPKLAATLVNNPIWNFQGGKDNNPNPAETERMYNALVQAGGTPKRSLVLDRDHWAWVDAFQNKAWLGWVYSQDKKQIRILHGKGPQIPTGGSLTLGISYGYKQYQWKLNGAIIPGANGYLYNATSNGTYSVSFVRADGTVGNSFPIIIGQGMVGANTITRTADEMVEDNIAAITAGPNPMSNELTVQLENMEDEVDYLLTDEVGRTWVSEKQFNTNGTTFRWSEGLPAGIYYLNVSTSSSKAKTLKITKE